MEALRHTNECVREPPHIHKAWELVSQSASCLPACVKTKSGESQAAVLLPTHSPAAGKKRREREREMQTLRLLSRCIIKLPNKRGFGIIQSRREQHSTPICIAPAARYLDHSWCEIPPEHLCSACARAWNEPRRRRADTGARKFRVSRLRGS